jgi:hypothetical protein
MRSSNTLKSSVRRAFFLSANKLLASVQGSFRPYFASRSKHPRSAKKGQTMDETVAIESRSEFALWAIDRAKEIVAQEGTALALAARDMDEDGLREAGQKLGSAISEALLEVFDGLLGQDDQH